MSDPVITALRAALDANPRQPAVWLHLAELLESAGDLTAALDAVRTAEQTGADPATILPTLLRLLRRSGALAEALIRAEAAVEGESFDPEVAHELVRILHARGDVEEAKGQYAALRARDPQVESPVIDALLAGEAPPESTSLSSPNAAPTPPSSSTPPSSPPSSPPPPERAAPLRADGDDEEEDLEAWASQFDWGDLKIGFDDVVGLDAVKKQIRLRIIAPTGKAHVMRAFGRRAGGGILLYGPPGCGKTYIARATAGEVNARFISVGIHDLFSKWIGDTEKMIHQLFEEARRNAPTVLFFDEFDAFAAARSARDSRAYQTTVDQLLQEMDGMSGENENILVFAATNVPWHVDSAFRRPGRFDRLFFLPPPDRKAREEYLRRRAESLPGGESVPVKEIAKRTDLYTFADLKALVERASESALERSLEGDEIHPVTAEDFRTVVDETFSTASEWLVTARNYARFANEGGQYDDLAKYLRKVKKG